MLKQIFFVTFCTDTNLFVFAYLDSVSMLVYQFLFLYIYRTQLFFLLYSYDVTWQPIIKGLTVHKWTDTLPLAYSVGSETPWGKLVYYVTITFYCKYVSSFVWNLSMETIPVIKKYLKKDLMTLMLQTWLENY